MSELSKAAANKIADGDEKRLIFPAISKLDDLEADSEFNVVNKLTAVIETADVRTFADDVFAAMKERLKNLRMEAFKRIVTDEYFDRDRAIKQIEDLLEFYWVAVPLPDESFYKPARLQEAKRFPNKNALCLKLDKRGGETTTVVDRWGRLDERLSFFTLLFVADKLPDGVAYEFQKLAGQLRDVPRAVRRKKTLPKPHWSKRSHAFPSRKAMGNFSSVGKRG